MYLYLTDTIYIFVFVSMPHESEIFYRNRYQTSAAIYVTRRCFWNAWLGPLARRAGAGSGTGFVSLPLRPPHTSHTPSLLHKLYTLPYGPLASTQSDWVSSSRRFSKS